jgi:hypothetical protein
MLANGTRALVPDERIKPGEDLQYSGKFEIWRTRARVLGEIPVREEARLAEDAGYTRIIGFARTDQQLDRIFVEEKSAVHGSVALDYYFLVDRKAGTARLLHSSPIGTLTLNSLVVTCRQLGVPGTGDGTGLTLAKVRFERLQAFEHPFELRGLVYERTP